MNVRLVIVSVIFGSWVGARAQAEPSQALHWYRAENAWECIDPRTLSELVETYTGPVLAAPDAADHSVEGSIERVSAAQFRIRVSVTVARGRPAGQRILTLAAAECRKLDGAIAFVIATTLDPGLASASSAADLSWLDSETSPGEQLRSELAEQPAAPPLASPPAAAELARSASAQPSAGAERHAASPRELWELEIAATAGSGVVPKASAGGLVAISRALHAHFALSVQLRLNTVLAGFEVEGGRSVDVQTYGSALLACGHTARGAALGVEVCLGPQVGFFSAHGNGFDQAHTVVQPSYGGELKLELRYALADKLWLSAGGLFDLGWRRPFVMYWLVDSQKEVFRSQVYSLQGALGLARSF